MFVLVVESMSRVVLLCLSLLCRCTSKIIFGNAFMQTPFKSTVHLEPNKISLFLNFGSPSVSFFFITHGQILSHELRENLTLKGKPLKIMAFIGVG